MTTLGAPYNPTWHQGSDLIMVVNYSDANGPVDLAGYSARMDIAPIIRGVPQGSVLALNSADFEGSSLDLPGETDNEITLTNDGMIQILVSRKFSLPGGPLAEFIDPLPPKTLEFAYDVFLRNTAGSQSKILEGKIVMKKSITKWT